MTVQIRGLAPDEWQTYRRARLAALADAPEAFGGSYAASAAYPEQTWREWCDQPSWFALDDGEPVGMVRVASRDGDLPELISMWVSPAVRGTSVAADLVGEVLRWARDQGAAGVELSVFAANPRARAFYERQGFTEHEVRDPLPDGRVEVVMRCPLS